VEKLLLITGAGISTESGIPDYRSDLGQYKRTIRPITHQEFMASAEWRQRYWARNYTAWPVFGSAPYNRTHKALAEFEKDERFLWLITQNIDGLHSAAGSTKLTELHGCARKVVCMSCNTKYPRDIMQMWISKLNPNWNVAEIGELRPDGDVQIPEETLRTFKVPECPSCGPGSILKTDVVFFGDSVDLGVVKHCYDQVQECSGLMVLGSSLTVMSGFRFVQEAYLRDVPIIIVNIGPTRADYLASLKIEARCSEIVDCLGSEAL